ncbi:MAG: hypothetical protein COZ06_36995 [Armatimonadetes bacterium CG_4_10_14_3_um_filter_66_18]|nr:MAG: hypothetical protein COZ06_36995 [Armatimonadetes bacterium CG_4_10_14_3_um_filter_66_18]
MRLTVTDGPEAGQAFTASQREVSLGRRRNCTVCLHGDSHVSRLHALLRETDSGWTIEDAGSHNGTLLNGRPVTSAVALPEGAEIALGSSTVRVELNPADESLMEAHHDLREVEATGRPQTVVERAFGAEDASNLGAETTGPADTWTPERLAALFALAAPVTSANPLEAILERVMDQLFANVKAERGYLLLENEATGKLAPRAVRRRGSLPEGSGPVEISRTLVHRAVKQRRAILTSDAADDASLRDGTASLAEFGIRSALCVPLIADEAVLGLILLDTQSVADAFTEGDLEFVSVLAGVAALRVNCIRLTARLAHETQLREQLQSFVPDVPLQHLLGGRLDLELGGEIREATILQADIREFTALTERLGPRQLTALLNEYFTAMCDVIRSHGGIVDKFVGDAILAVFGSPVPDDGQSVKAVRCALHMLEALDGLRTRWQQEGRPTFEVGIGLSRGTVLHGNIGSADIMQYSVIGDPVNTCSRLCALAFPQEVIVSESVFEHVWSLFYTVAREPVAVKGKSEPMKTYRVVGERAPKSE